MMLGIYDSLRCFWCELLIWFFGFLKCILEISFRGFFREIDYWVCDVFDKSL